jgi:alpha-L-fucosidase
MAVYNSTSPYFATPYAQFYLDIMVNRVIPKELDDQLFQINETYQYRPDMLAFDLYDLPDLWWVFYQRNPNTLTAPPWDFVADETIYLPKITTLQTVLGF